MSWEEIFPVLRDEMVADYQCEATEDEKARLRSYFAVEEVMGRKEAAHVVSMSLFWKPMWQVEEDYPSPSRELMENPRKFGLSSRFKNPWEFYVVPVLEAAVNLQKLRRDVVIRVYLANDLAFVVEELVDAGCEVFLMKSSSLRASPGMIWRFLAMEEGKFVTMSDADRAEDLIHNIERTELMAEGGLKYWRLPYLPGPGELNHGNPGWYRTTNACRFGAAVKLSVGLLAEAMVWHVEKGRLETHCQVGERKIPIWGSKWPDYGFDEYFLNTAIYPRVAKEGILTLMNRKDASQGYWFALDIEYAMKANAASEILYWEAGD